MRYYARPPHMPVLFSRAIIDEIEERWPEAFEQTLRGVAKSALLREDGVLVYEVRAAHKVAVPSAWKVLREKRYGKTRVLTLQQEKR